MSKFQAVLPSDADLEKVIEEAADQWANLEYGDLCSSEDPENIDWVTENKSSYRAGMWKALSLRTLEISKEVRKILWIYPDDNQNNHSFSAKVYDRWSGTGKCIEVVIKNETN